MLDVTLTGCGGTIPLKNRWLSSCFMRHNGKCLMIDCGEGTQIAMKLASLPFKPIGVICISHYHADHMSGLPGMLLSMGGEGRTEPVTIIGPAHIEKYVRALLTIAPELPFEVICRPVTERTETVVIDGFHITAFRVNHTLPTYGFSVHIPRVGKFDRDRAIANNVPLRVWSALQKNESVEYDGVTYTSDMVLGPRRRGIKVTYCTDTRPTPIIPEMAYDSDLFICEGMYGDEDKHDKATKTKHMTFAEAASLARDASPRRFWLTHFSPSMPNPCDYISEAREIFPTAECGHDGRSITLLFDEENSEE